MEFEARIATGKAGEAPALEQAAAIREVLVWIARKPEIQRRQPQSRTFLTRSPRNSRSAYKATGAHAAPTAKLPATTRRLIPARGDDGLHGAPLGALLRMRSAPSAVLGVGAPARASRWRSWRARPGGRTTGQVRRWCASAPAAVPLRDRREATLPPEPGAALTC